MLDLAVEALPVMGDDLSRSLIAQMAFAIVDGNDELRAVREILSAALEHSHAQDVENLRLRRRVADLLASRGAKVNGAA